MILYVQRNHSRMAAIKGPLEGVVTTFATRDGMPALYREEHVAEITSADFERPAPGMVGVEVSSGHVYVIDYAGEALLLPVSIVPWPTRYFTFGYSHRHEVDGVVYDKDVVVKITALDPRARMVEVFGTAWSFEYESVIGDGGAVDFLSPSVCDLIYYPRGVVDLP